MTYWLSNSGVILQKRQNECAGMCTDLCAKTLTRLSCQHLQLGNLPVTWSAGTSVEKLTMQTRVSFHALVILAFAMRSTANAQSQDCNAVLHDGIFDTQWTVKNTNVQKTYEAWTYQMNFGNHNEAIHSGIGIGAIVYGVPIKVDGEFDKNEKEAWFNQHNEYKNWTVSKQENFQKIVRTVNSKVLEAWEFCIATSSAAGIQAGLHAWVVPAASAQSDNAILHVSWFVPPRHPREHCT